jgi:hypothetical protein
MGPPKVDYVLGLSLGNTNSPAATASAESVQLDSG